MYATPPAVGVETEGTRVYASEVIRHEYEAYLRNLDGDLTIEAQDASTALHIYTIKENRKLLDVELRWLTTSPNATPERIAKEFQASLGYHLVYGPHGPEGACE